MHTLDDLNAGKLTGLKRLSLSANLTEFPDAIFSLADTLEILDLSNNQLSQLPDDLYRLRKLKVIFCSNNPFTALPEVLGRCENLSMVGFKSNQIAHVSEKALPPKLRWLILTDNKISMLPEKLGDCKALQKLMLAGNQLRALPNSLAACTNLQLVRVAANTLTTFPQVLLTLPKLRWLAFSGNPFCAANNEQTADAAATPATIPRIASDKVKLGEVLGQGASGVIYKATWQTPHANLPQDIAVKIFKGDVTSDGFPDDELAASLAAGIHPNLVQSLAQIHGKSAGLVMGLIPPHYRNLGLPPSLASCTRDQFPENTALPVSTILAFTEQMESLVVHLQSKYLLHGDLYAHNALVNDDAHLLFGDFGAASSFSTLPEATQTALKKVEWRALGCFIEDLLLICRDCDKQTGAFLMLSEKALQYKSQ